MATPETLKTVEWNGRVHGFHARYYGDGETMTYCGLYEPRSDHLQVALYMSRPPSEMTCPGCIGALYEESQGRADKMLSLHEENKRLRDALAAALNLAADITADVTNPSYRRRWHEDDWRTRLLKRHDLNPEEFRDWREGAAVDDYAEKNR